MKKIIIVLFSSILLLFSASAFADRNPHIPPPWFPAFEQAVEAEGLEKAISNILESGVSAEECVRCILEANTYNPYQVIKAAIMVGADLSGVVEAAKYNNISPAIISKAAVDAKAPIFGIVVAQATASEDGYAYTPLPGVFGASPLETGPRANLLTTTAPAGAASAPAPLILGVSVGGGGLVIYVSPSVPL